MADILQQAPQVYGIAPVRERLSALTLPPTPFDPNGGWSQSYSIVAVENDAIAGRLVLSRQPGETATLTVGWAKQSGPGSHWRLNGTIHSSNDPRSGPVDWTYRLQRHGGRYADEGKAVAGTTIERSFTIDRKTLIAKGGLQSAKTLIEQPLLLNWQLFDLSQRLLRHGTQVGPFTLIEQFEVSKPSQWLRYRGPADVDFADGKRALHAYEQLGVGVVPWVYWVDEKSSRLVAVVSGVEAYVWEKAAA